MQMNQYRPTADTKECLILLFHFSLHAQSGPCRDACTEVWECTSCASKSQIAQHLHKRAGWLPCKLQPHVSLKEKSHPSTRTAGETPLSFVMKAKTLKKDSILLAFLVKYMEITNISKQKQKMLSDVRNSASNFVLQKIFVVC